MLRNDWPSWITVGVGLLVVLTIGVTLIVVYLIWRDGYVRGWRKARNQPPTCTQCGYNMSGLTQCRCPECGQPYTLDQLWQTPIVPGYKTPPGKPEGESMKETQQPT